MYLKLALLFHSAWWPFYFAHSPNGYKLEFDKVDNRIEVMVGDSVIYDSGLIGYKPDFSLTVPIDESLLEYSKVLKVRLHNGTEGLKEGEDIHWEIRYYLYKGDEIVDSHWREADDGQIGVVFESSYIME